MGLLSQILAGLSGNAENPSRGTRRNDSSTSQIVTALLPVVLGMLANRSGAGVGAGGGAGMGGLGGLIEQFANRGYGSQANSWVGTGANEPLSPAMVGDVFGDDRLAQIAQSAGISTDQARAGLSQILPDAIHHLTPDGEVPSMESLSSSVGDFLSRLSSDPGAR